MFDQAYVGFIRIIKTQAVGAYNKNFSLPGEIASSQMFKSQVYGVVAKIPNPHKIAILNGATA